MQAVVSARLYTLLDNVLHYCDPHPKNPVRAAIPKKLRKKLVENHHGGFFGGQIYKKCVKNPKNCPGVAFVAGGGKPD